MAGAMVDVENMLLAHLRELARRESWRVSELPEGIAERPAAILGVLDKHGWIEVHLWKRVDKHPRPYENPSNLVPMRDPWGEWFSPLRSTAKDGSWKYILENYIGELAADDVRTGLQNFMVDEPPGPRVLRRELDGGSGGDP